MTKGQKLYEAVNPDGVWVHLSSLTKFEWENKATAYHDSFDDNEKNEEAIEWVLGDRSCADIKAMVTQAVENYPDKLRTFIEEASAAVNEAVQEGLDL